MPDGEWRRVIGAARTVEGGLANRYFVTHGVNLVDVTLTYALIDRTDACRLGAQPT